MLSLIQIPRNYNFRKMTLKDKKNKREYNRKLKAEGGASKSQEKNPSNKKNAKPPKADHGPNVSEVKEDSAKPLSDANQRLQEAEVQVRGSVVL